MGAVPLSNSAIMDLPPPEYPERALIRHRVVGGAMIPASRTGFKSAIAPVE